MPRVSSKLFSSRMVKLLAENIVLQELDTSKYGDFRVGHILGILLNKCLIIINKLRNAYHMLL